MGYIYFLIAAFAGLIKGYCGKKSSGYVKGIGDGILLNIIRMVLCSTIGAGLVVARYGLSAFSVSSSVWEIFLLSAVCLSVFNVSWLLSVKHESYMFLSVFTMLGSVITVICSCIWLRETISWNQWIGMLILLGSVYIMAGYNSKLKGKLTVAGLITVTICGVSSGLVDYSQKLYMLKVGEKVEVLNFYTYIISLLLLGTVWLLMKKQIKNDQQSDFKPVIIYIVIMSVCLFLNATFKTMAAGLIPAAQLYPGLQALSLILSALMSQVLLKEKMNRKSVWGIILAFIAMMFINLL